MELRTKGVALIALIAVVFFFSHQSFSVPVEPKVSAGAIEKTVEKPPKLKKETTVPELKAPPRPEMKIEDGRTIKVTKFNVTGAKKVSPAMVNAAVKDYEGKELSISQLKDVADSITRVYWKKGYITSFAYIPAQKIDQGVVEIAIIEGTVGEIKVQGNKYYKEGFIKKHLAAAQKEGVLNSKTLERGLLILNNEYPKLNVNATLTKGKTPGSTDVVLSVKDKLPLNFRFEYNNFGSRYTGRNRLSLGFDWANFTGHGDMLSFQILRTIPAFDDLTYYKGAYQIPINGYGTVLGADYSYMNYDVGQELEVLGIEGLSKIFNLTLKHPLIYARNQRLFVNGGLAVKDYTNYLLNKTFISSEDKVRTLYVGLSGDKTGNNNALYGQATATASLPGFLGGMGEHPPMPSRLDANGTWFKFNMDLGNIHRFGSCQLLLRGSVQWASDKLVTGEQFVIGGPDTVRGYPTGEFLGDNGYFVGAEFRTPVLPGGKAINKYVNFAFFVDHGGVYLKQDPLPGEKNHHTLSGYGAGLRITPTKNINVRFDAGFPIKGEEPSDGNDWQYWIQANVNF